MSAMLPALPPRDVSWYDPVKAGARCDLCPLKGSPFVPYSAPAEGRKLKFAVVGEGPGRRESIQRRAFVGQTGLILNNELQQVGLDRDEAWVTNSHLCEPENDQDADRATECCSPRLLNELAALPPDVPIVVLGKAASKSVLGVNSILLSRGFVWTMRDWTPALENAQSALKKLKADKKVEPIKRREKIREAELKVARLKARVALKDRTILPTLHPTFAFIRQEVWEPIFRIDLDRISRWVRGVLTAKMLADNVKEVKTIEALAKKERSFIVAEDPETIRQAFALMGPEVGVDIETERQKPLSPLKVPVLCVQVSDGVRGFVIAPWTKEVHAGLVTEGLRGKTAIFHNGYNFDLIALGRDGVSFDGVNIEDTLIAHHSFASQYPQKLDHVVATFLDSSPWKIRFGVRGAEEKGLAPQHVEDDELYEYGAADAFLTVDAWRSMQADLANERAVYEHDKELAVQARDLQVIGIPVDLKRREELSEGLRSRAAGLKGRMRRLARRPNFAPSKLAHVRHILFKVLKAPLLNPTATGLASTSNATLEALRTGGDTGEGEVRKDTLEKRVSKFAEALLRWRVAVKVKGTYIDAVQVFSDGRAHYNWRSYGTVSGRFSCRLQSCPRWSRAVEDRAREMYVASDEDHVLLYFDMSQAEGRAAANLSGDPVFIETCKGDIHTGNAKILFPDAMEMLVRDPKGENCPKHGSAGSKTAACNCGKPFRDIAKNAGFAVAYLAEAVTVFAYLRANGFPVNRDRVEAMLGMLRSAYSRYYAYVAENVRFVEQNGYLRTALMGRVRWFGFHPKPQEVANLPIQSLIADVMNVRSLAMQKRWDQETPGTQVVAQVHDALVLNTPRKYAWLEEREIKGKLKKVPAGPAVQIIEEAWKEPVRLKKSVVCREEREFLLPVEMKIGDRWSAFG